MRWRRGLIELYLTLRGHGANTMSARKDRLESLEVRQNRKKLAPPASW